MAQPISPVAISSAASTPKPKPTSETCVARDASRGEPRRSGIDGRPGEGEHLAVKHGGASRRRRWRTRARRWRILPVMGHENGRDPALADVLEGEAPHGGAERPVELAERLVQQKGSRLGQQRPHQRRRAPAARPTDYAAAAPQAFKAAILQRLRHALDTRLARACGDGEEQVFAHRHVREEIVVLEQAPDTAAFGRQALPAARG